MRTQARAVVIGGGVAGASILDHLARLGWRDVVLVEQFQAHARLDLALRRAGRAAALHPSLTRMMQYSVGLYAELARETGKDPAGTSSAACGWRAPPRATRRSAARRRGPRPSGWRWRSCRRGRRRSSSR